MCVCVCVYVCMCVCVQGRRFKMVVLIQFNTSTK